MSYSGFKGIDVRQTANRLLFRAHMTDANYNNLTSGTCTLRLHEVQSDGTLLGYDFNDNTFGTGVPVTATLALTHRTSNGNAYNTGIFSNVLTTLTGFTKEGIYLATVNNEAATPRNRMQEFQFGGAEGDLRTTSDNRLDVNVEEWNDSAVKDAVGGTPRVGQVMDHSQANRVFNHA